MKIIRLVFTLALLFAVAARCCAESLQVTSTPTPVQVKHGASVAMAVSLKNVLTPHEPVTITAEAEWEDEYGTTRTTTASATITVVQPVKISRYKVIIPALFVFVAGGAKVDGQPAAPTLDSGRLTFEIGRTLLESESVTLEYSVKAL